MDIKRKKVAGNPFAVLFEFHTREISMLGDTFKETIIGSKYNTGVSGILKSML